MDPITAAGLALSVAGLALQLFSGCVRGYQLLLDVADMPQKYEHLRIRLRLEQVRLLSWGEKVGLLEETLREPSSTLQLHRNLIFDILLEVQRLFADCLKIETKFNGTTSTKADGLGKRRIEAAPQLGSKRTEAMLAKALRILETSSLAPRRLEWAMVKHNKFERLIEDLIRYNDSMVSLLDKVTLQQVQTMQTQSHLIMLQLSSKIDDLRQLTQAMQMKEVSDTRSLSQSRNMPSSTVRAITANSQAIELSLARLAAFKADRLDLESDTLEGGSALIDPRKLHLKESFGSKELAIFQEQAVWIEWKEYDKRSQIPLWHAMIEVRVRRLAALLGMRDKPPEFRAPQCLGCFHDVDEDMARYGLVYEMPTNGPKPSKPVSLHDLLKHGATPSLTQRIKLASALASSLMFLHSVNWLHKGLRSENVVLITASDGETDLSSPIISGFEYARPDLPNEMTEKPQEDPEHDIYRHPCALTNSDARSQKSWDIYSLGVVLIEVAFWKSIDTITDIDLNHKSARSKVRKVRNLFLEPVFLFRIGTQAGDRYQEVVRRCISGGADLGVPEKADESDPNVGAELLDVFAQEVVGALQGITL